MMKKFILDFRDLLSSSATNTALLPRTMLANRIHSTVNCSVCEQITQHWFITRKILCIGYKLLRIFLMSLCAVYCDGLGCVSAEFLLIYY
jgi:hypothetical protein